MSIYLFTKKINKKYTNNIQIRNNYKTVVQDSCTRPNHQPGKSEHVWTHANRASVARPNHALKPRDGKTRVKTAVVCRDPKSATDVNL